MNKTRVDDMLIEMISPKIKEIEEKFSSGKGLNQEDINTLLLKSQYNHINHLDDKLNEVTASVAALENKFTALENKFVALENKFDLLNEKIEHTIQKALNKNMMLLITVMGFFVIISKLIDKIQF
jgi:predicted nuclease with TOPRIM domain